MSTIDRAAVDALLARAHREVDDGLLPSCQVALALDGELVAFETFGDATPDTRYVVFSCTKAFVAGAVWALIGDGLVDVRSRSSTYVPEFGTNGKDVITVEQVMLHTAGFPHAPLGPPPWATPRGAAAPPSPAGGSTGSPARATSTTPPRPTGCWPRSSSGSPAATSATSSQERVTGPAGLPRVLGLEPATGRHRRRCVTVGRAGHARGDPRPRSACDEPAGHRGDARGAAALQPTPRSAAVGVPGGGGVDAGQRPGPLLPGAAAQPGRDVAPGRPRRRHRQRPQPPARALHRRSRPTARLGLRAGGRRRLRATSGASAARCRRGPSATTARAASSPGPTRPPACRFGYFTNGHDQHVVREPRRGTPPSPASPPSAPP